MPPIWVETPDGRGKEHDMTMQMTGQTVRLPRFRHRGWVLAAIGALLVVAGTIGLATQRGNDDGQATPAKVSASTDATIGARAGEGTPPMGGQAELYRDQQAEAAPVIDTRGGLGELYGEQEAARRAAAIQTDPCLTQAGDLPPFC